MFSCKAGAFGKGEIKKVSKKKGGKKPYFVGYKNIPKKVKGKWVIKKVPIIKYKKKTKKIQKKRRTSTPESYFEMPRFVI